MVQPNCKGASMKYVHEILGFFDHLPLYSISTILCTFFHDPSSVYTLMDALSHLADSFCEPSHGRPWAIMEMHLSICGALPITFGKLCVCYETDRLLCSILSRGDVILSPRGRVSNFSICRGLEKRPAPNVHTPRGIIQSHPSFKKSTQKGRH